MDNEENKEENLEKIPEEKKSLEKENTQGEEIKADIETQKEEQKQEETKQEEVKEAKVVSNNEQKQTDTKDNSKGLGIAALVLGIIALVLWCIWYISIPCAILAIIFGAVGRKKAGKSMAIAGLVMGIITVCLLVIIIVFGVSIFGLALKDGLSNNENGSFYRILNEMENRGIDIEYDYDI